jgi:hypothetical protein
MALSPGDAPGESVAAAALLLLKEGRDGEGKEGALLGRVKP